MNYSVLLSSLVFTLSIIFANASAFAGIGIINFVIAAFVTWVIEFVLIKIKCKPFELSSKRSVFINIIYVCIAVVLLLTLVAIFIVLQTTLTAVKVNDISFYSLLILLIICCLMSFGIEKDSMIHVGRIISYLIIGIMIIVLLNIPYELISISFGEIVIEEVMKLIPICLSHTLFILYLKFNYMKECIIGNIIGSLFLILLILFVGSTDLHINNYDVTTLLSSMTLIGAGSLTERIDVFIVCMILAVEAYRISIIGNILSKLCITYVNQFVMKLIVVTVVVVGILLGLSVMIVEMVLVFSGLLAALFSIAI